MKTIEQEASIFAHKKINSIPDSHIETLPKSFVMAASIDGFKAGVEFSQKWIPVKEELPEENYRGYVNFKIGNYVSCKKVDSQIEFLNLIDVYGFTHWRPLEYK